MTTTPPRLLVLSILYGLGLVWGGEWLACLIRGWTFPMGTEVGPRWVRTFLATAPFALLAIYALLRRPSPAPRQLHRAGIIGLVLSLLVWGWYFLDPVIRPLGGANIGLGIALMSSPVPLFLVMWAICRRPPG